MLEGLGAAMESARWQFKMALQILGLAVALYHSITWFKLKPKIMTLYIGEDRLQDFWAAILMGYLPWLVVSVILLWGIGSQIGG